MAKKKYNVIREEMLQVASNVAQEKNIDQDFFYDTDQFILKLNLVTFSEELNLKFGFLLPVTSGTF